MNSLYRDLSKIVSDLRVDASITKNIFEEHSLAQLQEHSLAQLQECSLKFRDSTVEFKKIKKTFSTTVETRLNHFSGTLYNDMKMYMGLTGRFTKLQENLTDAVTQANLPKEWKFDTTVVVDYLKKSDIENLKTDWNSIPDYSILKSYLKQGFSKIKFKQVVLTIQKV